MEGFSKDFWISVVLQFVYLYLVYSSFIGTYILVEEKKEFS